MSDTGFVKRLIQAHISEIQSIRDIGRMTTRSWETIRKDFVRWERATPAAFIRRTRVAKAKRLLMQTELSCQVICHRVGFSREEVGERVFKRLTGLTMKEHRRQSRIKVAKSLLRLNTPNGIGKSTPIEPTGKVKRSSLPESSTRIVNQKSQ